MSVELREIVLIPWLEQFQMIILKGRKEGSKEKGVGGELLVGNLFRINRKVIFRVQRTSKVFLRKSKKCQRETNKSSEQSKRNFAVGCWFERGIKLSECHELAGGTYEAREN